MNDLDYMKRALELAKKGLGRVNPNPMVGAVIVKDNQIIGEGYHECYGDLHAERNALENCSVSPEGAIIYVTLEPCCHYGKTPPCTEAIIENKIKRVVIGSSDPNPNVAGKGAKLLREHGIEVTEDIMRYQCDAINPVFFHYIKTGTPYVIMKYAMTLDGKIATHTGESKWITGEKARELVHKSRNVLSGIMVGVNTVIQDDPMLTCRIEGGRNPVRIICDTNLRTPKSSKVVTTTEQARTIIATTNKDPKRHEEYEGKACEIIVVSEKDGHVNLAELMKKLGDMQIDSLILEGGAAMNWSALNAGIVNKVQAYISPKLFGGENAKTPISGIGVDFPDQAYRLDSPKTTFIDGDILIEGEVIKCSQE